MKPRARRVTLAAAALGTGVIGVLVAAHWGTVRDHVEAWHFQLTRETLTIEPDPRFRGMTNEIEKSAVSRINGLYTRESSVVDLCRALAAYSGCAVTAANEDKYSAFSLEDHLTADKAAESLLVKGYRVLEQRYPRRAYIVIREEAQKPRKRDFDF